MAKKGHLNFNFPVWDSVSIEAKRFVIELLQKDPNSRPSAENALQHAWII